MIWLTLLACLPRPWSKAWVWPENAPIPHVPADNPMSAEKVALGRVLFYDTQLSVTGQMSCASCHDQASAFTDGKARSVGTTGEQHPRGAMSLANVAYASRLAWASASLTTLEHQALLPLFGEDPVEMGLTGVEEEVLERLRKDPESAALFQAAWPNDNKPVTLPHVVQAIASFERTLLSFQSPYDAYARGESTALTPAQERGMTLFFSERLECFHCHGGPTFSDSVDHAGLPEPESPFHNTALYNTDGKGSYPPDNTGLMESTGDPKDMGRFKAPTLRNIVQTAPYMHDGSVQTLEQVVDHYAQGGRAGQDHPLKSEFVQGFVISESETQDLLAFFEALSDPEFLSNPAFSDPQDAP